MLLGFGSKSLVQTPVETPEVTTLITNAQFAMNMVKLARLLPLEEIIRYQMTELFCNDVSPSILQLKFYNVAVEACEQNHLFRVSVLKEWFEEKCKPSLCTPNK